MEVGELHAVQAARWRAADPLLPTPEPPAPDPTLVPGGAGWTTRHDIDPEGMSASWTGLRNHALTALLADDDPAAALGALLDQWEPRLGPPDDDESTAEVVWPSRDTTPVLALARHGFAPAVVLAAGRPGRATAAPVPGLTVRPAVESDVDVVARFGLEIVRYDGRFGALGARPSTLPRLVEGYAAALRRPTPTIWLAEQHGRPVGMCSVDPPGYAPEAQGLCSASRVGYLGSMYVNPTARGTGIGSALHATADAALAAAGAEVTLLHHTVPNPISTPFWYRLGYRPLWTHWQRRPAVRLPAL
ncbi:GNAT family N-acetyltransferase [Pseudonocardia humida]|uniref:GNAT family N-acetyltransferase n=1 Tax=Pseudonocardia humida TaxID=2800819 RepID=A0ABT0ZU52_9PSEU|nr:GNAT family N-acetyltransferase [Pseudonocardia humida]MCO1654261.1 GNAT family N-acetyltransferase [Pseudonocardia humida]